jgi:hypothetical protein
MPKLISYIPDVFSIQWIPRVPNEPFMFTDNSKGGLWNSNWLRFGSVMVFMEYAKG